MSYHFPILSYNQISTYYLLSLSKVTPGVRSPGINIVNSDVLKCNMICKLIIYKVSLVA